MIGRRSSKKDGSREPKRGRSNSDRQHSTKCAQEQAQNVRGSKRKSTQTWGTGAVLSAASKSCSLESTVAALDRSNQDQQLTKSAKPRTLAATEQPSLRLEWWEADQLQPYPQNWRRHPPRQKEAVARLLREVGWAGALLYNERTGRLLDGHLRKELCHGQRVPVLVGNWSEEQERQIVALLDPLTALAEVDVERWHELLQSLADMDARLALALDTFARQQGVSLPEATLAAVEASRPSADLPECRFEVIVECQDEASQRNLYERLTAEGYRCRVLTF